LVLVRVPRYFQAFSEGLPSRRQYSAVICGLTLLWLAREDGFSVPSLLSQDTLISWICLYHERVNYLERLPRRPHYWQIDNSRRGRIESPQPLPGARLTAVLPPGEANFSGSPEVDHRIAPLRNRAQRLQPTSANHWAVTRANPPTAGPELPRTAPTGLGVDEG
jgi:hypothetical protein